MRVINIVATSLACVSEYTHQDHEHCDAVDGQPTQNSTDFFGEWLRATSLVRLDTVALSFRGGDAARRGEGLAVFGQVVSQTQGTTTLKLKQCLHTVMSNEACNGVS